MRILLPLLPAFHALILLTACSGSGSSVDDGDPGTDSPPLNLGEIRGEPLFGSIGDGTGGARDEAAVADPWSVAAWFAAGQSNSTNLAGSLGADGEPVGAVDTLLNRPFAVPDSWPPASATDATGLPLTPAIVATGFAGAFEPGLAPWTANWTVALDGRIDSFGFFGAGRAPGSALGNAAQPIANRSCPTGTTRPGEPIESFTTRFGALDNDELQRFIGFGGSYDLCRLPPRITGTVTLTNDNVYLLSDQGPGTYVGNGEAASGSVTRRGAVLRVQPGTLILGESGRFLVVTRGSRIEARGLESAPITFSSVAQIAARFDRDPATDPAGTGGEWGGLVLMGNARVAGCTEGLPCDLDAGDGLGLFGGADDAESSGELVHVVVRNAGLLRDGGGQGPAVRLLGAGRATNVDRLQVHASAGTGIEQRGGSAFLVHTAVTASGADALSWDEGWTGGAQFLLSLAGSATRGTGLHGSSSGDAPVSFPLLANLTVLGPAIETSGGDRQALRLGAGTRLYLSNSILTGTHANGCLDLDDDTTFLRAAEEGGAPPSLPGPHLRIDNSLVDCAPFNFNENG